MKWIHLCFASNRIMCLVEVSCRHDAKPWELRKAVTQQPLHYLNGDRHQIWCFAKWLFQTFLEGSANDCQKHRQEDRSLHPSAGNAWLFVVNTLIKGVLKEVTSVLCWNEQKGEVKPLYLMRFMLCCGILFGTLQSYRWNLSFYLLTFLPHFLHWVESCLLLVTYSWWAFHSASVMGV